MILSVHSLVRALAKRMKNRAYQHVHTAADAQRPAVQALMQAAFARGHAAVSREQLVKLIAKEDHGGLMIAVDMAITATANALHESDLHDVLFKTLVDSGKTAFNHVKALRSAGSDDEPRDDHGQWTSAGLPTKRPDGAPVVEKPVAGSLAEKRGIKKGDTVTYHYRAIGDDMGHSGRGKVIGFVKNAAHIAKLGSIQDVVIHTGGSVKFVAEKNVRGSRLRSAVDPSISTDFVFDDTDPAAVEWAKQHAAELVQSISKTSRDDIRQLVEDAFTEHLTADDLADEIENVIGDAARAETIARTETMKASNVGQQQAWDQAVEQGLLLGTEQQEWITTPDDKLCPICESLDGQTAPLDGSFSDDSGDEYDGPPAHPNCRCTLGLSLEPATAIRAAYNDDQPRDKSGEWTGGQDHPDMLRAKNFAGRLEEGNSVDSATVKGTKSPDTKASDFVKMVNHHLADRGLTLTPKTGSTIVHSPRGGGKTGKATGWKVVKTPKVAAFRDDEPRNDHGQWTSGGNLSARAKRALATHKPSTAAMQRHAESNETVIAKMVGGTRTEEMQSNAPMDVVKGKHGLEVKTLLNNSNDKITMHPSSRRRKEDYAAKNHAVVHTVVLDDRPGRQNSGHRIYYRRGVGAFRLHTMTPVKNAGHLKQLMEAK